MDVKIHQRFLNVFKLALFSITFLVTGIVAINASAASDSADTSVPSVYNGVTPQRDFVTNSNGDTNQKFTSWISLDDKKSNYVGSKANGTTSSILNLDSYKKNPSSLYEHIRIENDSKDPMPLFVSFGLPLFYPRNISTTATSPVVVYRGNGTVTPTEGSTSSGLTTTYADKDMNYTSEEGTKSWTATDWENLRAIRVQGTLNRGSYYQLDIPLKLENPNTVSFNGASGSDPTFELSTVDQNWGYHNAIFRFAQGTNANNQFGINGKNRYLVTYRSGTNYYRAADIQNLMPIIKPEDIVINNFDASYNATNNDFPYLFSGGYMYVNFPKLKDANGNDWIQTIQNNGYGVPVSNGSFLQRYAWNYSGEAATTANSGGSQWMNKDGIGGINLQLIKVIDVKGINDQDQLTLSQGAKWDPKSNVTIWNPEAMEQKAFPANEKPDLTIESSRPLNADGTLNTSYAGSFDVTYTLKFTYSNKETRTIKKIIHVIIPGSSSNGGGASTPSATTNTTSSSQNGSSNSSTSTSDNTSTSTSSIHATVPDTAAVKGAAVYAIKPIYMYKNATFKKSQRIASYPKTKRTNRPMFVVIGYARSNNGALRYKVRDVNYGKKTANKVGYITANQRYVVNVYYRTMPKNKKITVIAKKGINAYRNLNLTKKIKHYKKSTRLTVKKIVKRNLTTRYQLSNGRYVTANKKLVIQGNY
ncbi:DUF5776 domain-containing protein [Lentilactobacillus raoultii]|uniref:DUF5776 domain-containing protein n=1 Tax=Lentilactobacillus raoultii TaxID=1987503 RepID=A0ABW3PP35_9LACO|nr:DUF5776 domain-containing protein [Lentilactobacillus raoultii]